jgi:hypothetical protein
METLKYVLFKQKIPHGGARAPGGAILDEMIQTLLIPGAHVNIYHSVQGCCFKRNIIKDIIFLFFYKK